MSYSCIIAVTPQDLWKDESSKRLFALKNIFDEVLIVSNDHNLQLRLPANFRRVSCMKNSRAALFNQGATEAKSQFLSFLNFDTEFDSEDFAKLRMELRPEILYYFGLTFSQPAPRLCALNALGANLRADWTALPCADQCFTLDKKSFFEVGAFSENLLSGENEDFAKRWKERGFPLKKTKGIIAASASKYLKQGWLKSTAKNILWNLKFWAGKEPKQLKAV